MRLEAPDPPRPSLACSSARPLASRNLPVRPAFNARALCAASIEPRPWVRHVPRVRGGGGCGAPPSGRRRGWPGHVFFAVRADASRRECRGDGSAGVVSVGQPSALAQQGVRIVSRRDAAGAWNIQDLSAGSEVGQPQVIVDEDRIVAAWSEFAAGARRIVVASGAPGSPLKVAGVVGSARLGASVPRLLEVGGSTVLVYRAGGGTTRRLDRDLHRRS